MGGMLPGPGILGFIMAAAGVLNGGSVISDGSWTSGALAAGTMLPPVIADAAAAKLRKEN